METVTDSEITNLTEEMLELQEEFTTDNGLYNTINVINDIYNSTSNLTLPHNEASSSSSFETFIIFEIVMTAMELVISIVAALKMSRWRRNYRNQMLMQLSLSRFVKRTIFFVEFMIEKYQINSAPVLRTVLISSRIYIDLVIIILICFFIKHMYDSLLVVIVKIRKKTLYNVLYCSWLIPIPVTVIWTIVLTSKISKEWTAYLIICIAVRWPIMFIGTLLYLTVLYKVVTDNIRQFARSLTIITFLLCFVINFYLFSKDIIILWCFESFTTLLISYILGLLLNFLVLCLYIILIALYYKSVSKSCDVLADNSVANVL